MPVRKVERGSIMMDAEQAQASLDEIRERERQSTEQAIRGSRPRWWHRPLALPVAITGAVLLDLADQGVVPSWVPVVTTVLCVVVIVVVLVTARVPGIEPRHRPGWSFGTAAFVATVVGCFAVNEVARAFGSPWLTTVNAVSIMVAISITNVLWRRAALRAAARDRDAA